MSDCLGEIAFHSSGEVYRDGAGGGEGLGGKQAVDGAHGPCLH